MLPRERVIAALEHREPDRIPWGEHSIDYNVYEDILGRETLVQAKIKQTIAYWEGRRDEIVEYGKRDRLDLAKALEFDIVTVSAVPPKDYRPKPMKRIDESTYEQANGDIYHVSSATGDLRLWKKVADDYVAPTVESLQERIDALEDEPLGHPDDEQWELVRHAVAEMGDTHFIMLMSGDVAWPFFGATDEEQYMNLVLEPEICAKISELQGKRLIRQIPLYAKLNVDGIMPCGDLGTSAGLMASPELYRSMVYPWNKAHVAQAHKHGLKVLKHCCGHVWPVINELAEVYDAYEGIQATGGMDIGDLKDAVGDQICLWGGIWHEHIIGSDEAQIRADARYAFSRAAPGGGYIMGSSHSLAVGAKAANILEMKRLRDEWGGYPISATT
jgi:uroporphyrinogen decarboxylase